MLEMHAPYKLNSAASPSSVRLGQPLRVMDARNGQWVVRAMAAASVKPSQ